METTQNELKPEKWLVFTVAEYSLALPIAQVLQVVNNPSVTRELLNKIGLVQIGRHVIRLLDLHRQIAVENESVPETRPFLIITRDLSGSLCAIPVSEPPTLIEVAPEMMQLLPQSHPRSRMAKIASHAATIDDAEATVQAGVAGTVFLLDIKQF